MMTTFTSWVAPLLDSFPRMDEVYFNHIAKAPDGRYELKDVEEAATKGFSRRQLRRIRNRLNKLAWIFEYQVNERIISD